MVNKKLTRTAIIILTLFFYQKTFAFQPNTLKKIFFKKEKNIEIVSIILKEKTPLKSFVLHNPERIVIDIENTIIPQIRIHKNISSKILKKIRTGQFKKYMARIVLDLGRNSGYTFNITSNKYEKNYHEINIEILSGKYSPKKQKNKLIFDKNLSKLILVPGEEETFRQENFIDENDLVQNKEKQPVKQSEQIEDADSKELVFLFDDSVPENIFEDSPDEKKQSFSFSGEITTRATKDRNKSDLIENNYSFRNKTMVEAKYKKYITASVLSDYLHFSSEEKTNDYNFDINELKFEYTSSFISFCLGKQIVRWGKTDQISPVDTLNPEDLRESITYEYEDRKIPLWMADLKLFSRFINIEAVYIPFFKKAKLDDFETDWSFMPHFKKEIQKSNIPPALKEYFKNMGIKKNDPDDENEFGLRLFKTFGKIDTGISWHRTNEDLPFIKNFPIKNLDVKKGLNPATLLSSINPADLKNEKIELEYKQADIFGMEFETTLAGLGLRGEAALQDDESFITSSFTSIRRKSLIYIIGADYNAPSNIYINLQFSQKHIYDYIPEILYSEKDNFSLSGKLSKDFTDIWTKISVQYLFNLTDHSKYYCPKIEYNYFKNINLSAGINIFSGKKDTYIGNLRDNSQYFMDLVYFF